MRFRLEWFSRCGLALASAACGDACHGQPTPARSSTSVATVGAATSDAASSTGAGAASGAHLPLLLVNDAPLPGNPVRFDYEDIDPQQRHLVVAHMNDASVDILDLADASVVKVVPNIPTARGVVVADDVGRIFVTSSPNQLVILSNTTLVEVGRVTTGNAPDGDGWDPVDKIAATSDQADGAISLIESAGDGKRTQIPLGVETGNVVFDAGRGHFWITSVRANPPDRLQEIDPVAKSVVAAIDLPGCAGAHGLRIHPDGKSALVACEHNDSLARVDLGGAHAVVVQPTGAGPDVLSIDPSLGWIYVAAESGDVAVFDIARPGLTLLGKQHVGDNAHSVAVDPATHRAFFPLKVGPHTTPVMRVMKPSGL